MPNLHPIQASGLTLELGGSPILRGVDWIVPEGTATGLIGRNGAGKSTLIHAVLGLIHGSDGECLTLGQDARRLDDERLAQIGFVDQTFQLLGWLTVQSHIRHVSMMQPNWDRSLEQRLLDEFDLRADAGQEVGRLSIGERQRLAVLLALCHRPKLCLLDEPVSAQDPIFRTAVLHAIRDRMIEDGTTIVLSSHVLRDIESIVDRVTMLNNGRVGTNEELDTLKEQHQQWIVTGMGQLEPVESYVVRWERIGGMLRLFVRASESERRAFEREHGVAVEVQPVTLEELFPLLLDPPAKGAGVGARGVEEVRA